MLLLHWLSSPAFAGVYGVEELGYLQSPDRSVACNLSIVFRASPSTKVFIIHSTAGKNRKGQCKQPCMTPVITWNASASIPLSTTLKRSPSYESQMMLTIFSGTPQCLRRFHKVLRSTLSSAFSKSMELISSDEFHSIDRSKMIRSSQFGLLTTDAYAIRCVDPKVGHPLNLSFGWITLCPIP